MDEPINFKQVCKSKYKDDWMKAMEIEMASLQKNHTRSLVDRPKGKKVI